MGSASAVTNPFKNKAVVIGLGLEAGLQRLADQRLRANV